jgi:hypothetical protein
MANLLLFILYLRLFGQSNSTRMLVWVGILSCTIFYTLIFVFVLATCSPRQGETPIVADASERCAKLSSQWHSLAAFNLLSDVYLVIIPIPVVMKLQMSTDKKIRVCSVFMTGIL